MIRVRTAASGRDQTGSKHSTGPAHGPFGGSHAQRDLIDQTLLCAAARAGDRAVGHALLNERLLAKRRTPLTEYWLSQVS